MPAAAQKNPLAQSEDVVIKTQDDSMQSANESPEKKTESSTKSKKTSILIPEDIAIPPAISITQQYKNDLTHYLSADSITPLLAGTDDYIMLITENTNINNKGVAILLPDWQQGATNPKAINFLRKELPQHGWTTLSIQPLNKPENYPSNALEKKTRQQENQTRINNYKKKLAVMMNTVLEQANEYPGIIIVIAQGNHGAMMVDLLNTESTQNSINQVPNALILLSSYLLTSQEFITTTNTNFAKKLAASEYPILDLYLKKDNHIVLYTANQRLLLSKQQMKVYYRQRQLNNNAIGYYPETELITQINGWLRTIGW